MESRFSIEPNERLRVPIAWQGEEALVADKPSGMASEPGKGQQSNTLMNALFALHGNLLQNMGEKRDFGLLHRLDRETSGLILVALRPRAYDALRKQFEERTIVKRYLAVVLGRPPREQGLIRKPLLEVTDEKKQKKSVVSGSGKPAVTAYRVLSSKRGVSLVECRLGTGRLHQIRVHLAAVGCPVLGDGFYAPPEAKKMAARLALHAHMLAFNDPTSGEKVVVRSDVPGDLNDVVRGRGLRVGLGSVES